MMQRKGATRGPFVAASAAARPDRRERRTGTSSRSGLTKSLLGCSDQARGASTWRPTRRQARQTPHACAGVRQSCRGPPPQAHAPPAARFVRATRPAVCRGGGRQAPATLQGALWGGRGMLSAGRRFALRGCSAARNAAKRSLTVPAVEERARRVLWLLRLLRSKGQRCRQRGHAAGRQRARCGTQARRVRGKNLARRHLRWPVPRPPATRGFELPAQGLIV